MVYNAWTNNRRTTLDAYEFQEFCGGKWEYSHTDIGTNVMLENKKAYQDNQRLGGNPFRIIKRREYKANHTPEQHRLMELADLKSLVERLEKLIEARPDSKRIKTRQWQVEKAKERIALLEQ